MTTLRLHGPEQRRARVPVLLPSFTTIGLVLCLGGIAVADEKDSRDRSAGYLQWVGDWEVSADVNRILGFADAERRAFATWVHPTSFRLSFDKKIDKKIGERIGQMPDTFRDQFFKPNGHEIVATGKWETKFVEEQGLGTNCFVTHQGGATFLWCEAPYVGWFPLRVALIQGKTRDHDVLVIDFNSFHDRLAGGQESQDTVAYKRSKKKQLNTRCRWMEP